MKLYSNSGNSLTLKVLISALYGEKTLEVEIVNIDDSRFQKPRRLPVFETDEGDYLFSTNSASTYLFPSKSKEVFNWLEWEATQLLPALVRCNGTKYDSQLLKKLLHTLDDNLSKQDFILKGSSISVCDISIWSTLYPIYSDIKMSSLFSSNYKNIDKWFKKLSELPKFKEALEKFKVPQGVECIQNISSTTWFPAVAIKDGTDSSQTHQTITSLPDVTKESITEEELKAVEESWNKTYTNKPRVPTHPILPISNEKNVLITSALPYVNNVPHLGNIIGCVLSADVFARYCRLRNWNALFISGTDEYGTATETKAIEEGLTPKQICDKYFKMHKETYEWFNIKFDHFGRTTTPQQTEIVQEFFKKVHENGYTLTQEVDQLLCEKCNRFLADRFVEGTCPRCGYTDARGDQCDGCGHLINAVELIDPKCKICKGTPVIKNSQHYFLDLPKVEERVKTWLNKVNQQWSHNARAISNTWLKDGLKPRCVTRDLKWGIPVPLPGFEQKVFYVWFDAPFGYVSMTKCYTADNWKKWWEVDENVPVTYYQFMAKDNVPFHSIMFPSALIAAGENKYKLVDHLIATEYLNYEDGKFSKSRGVGVFGTDAKLTGIPSDFFRFYLLYMRPEGQDSNFSWADLALKINSELLNNLGNFINRALQFVDKFFGGIVPDMKLTKEDYKLLVYITREVKGYIDSINKGKLRDGIKHIMSISKHGNLFMQESQPWSLLKGSEEDKVKAGTAIGLSCNIACLLALLLKPYMPDTVGVISKQLNISSDLFVLTPEITQCLKPGHKIGKPAPLFIRIEQALVDELKVRFAGKQNSEGKKSKEKGNKGGSGGSKVLNIVPTNNSIVAELETAVAKQGDIVRNIKSSGAPKSEWMPHVQVLLELKKQLEETKKSMPSISELEEKITKQGDIVRKMKSSGVPRAEWQPELNILLELKKQLTAAQQASNNS